MDYQYNEEIYAKAKNVLEQQKRMKGYEYICLKAKVCPNCGNMLVVRTTDTFDLQGGGSGYTITYECTACNFRCDKNHFNL